MESQVVAFYILVSLFENLGENTEHKCQNINKKQFVRNYSTSNNIYWKAMSNLSLPWR